MSQQSNGFERVPVFILAGGLGTRISEESHLKPKPMIEIGEIPIMVHIMRWYYKFGFNDFVICAGYRSWEIKNYFLNYQYRQNHLMIDHRMDRDRKSETFGPGQLQEKWRVRVIDTEVDCQTGGRISRAFNEIQGDSFTDFAVTYGDGVCDVDLNREWEFHKKHGRFGTVLGVRPSARFGELDLSVDGLVSSFKEKPQATQGFINGGFFFFKRGFKDYLTSDSTCILERDPLSRLSEDQQLLMHPHEGFWHPMDSLRDKTYLEGLWNSKKAPWKV